MKHRYYHDRIKKTLRFLIDTDKKILYLGSFDGNLLDSLSPKIGVGVEIDKKLFNNAKRKFPEYKFVCSEYENYLPKTKFDYIILSGVLGVTKDLAGVLKNIQNACTPTTRIIVYQHNYLWQWLLSFLERFNFKRKEGVQNWLSISDTMDYLEGAGLEVTRIFRRTLFPISAFGIGNLVNFVGTAMPFLDFFNLDQYLIARPKPETIRAKKPSSLTICLTVRNEKKNINRIVKSLPKITKDQEILFVEGHSTDGTREEIERMIKKYPGKNIRVMGQPGKGQGDAIRVGFKAAKGDIIILYEGDGTSNPGDIIYFYEAMREGRFEFIEGSRFVYPLDPEAMPFLNKIGNIFFAKWFSFFLGQRTTDVLSGIKAVLKRDYKIIYHKWGFLGFDDPFGDFELLYGAARNGLRIGEIPMRYYPRIYGESKSSVFVHGTYLLRMAVKGHWIFRNS